jgi:proliferating cell nuclear antigen PCNA
MTTSTTTNTPSSTSTFTDAMRQDPDIILSMKTLHSQQWRTLSDSLKDLLTEANITFKKDGLRIIALDQSRSALIDLHATAEYYYLKHDVTIGVNISNLYKIMKSLTTSGFIIAFTIKASDQEHLTIEIINSDKKTTITHRLNLLDLPVESVGIPSTVFDRIISLPSNDVQKYIKELSSISNDKKITITSTKNSIAFSCTGDSGESKVEIFCSATGLNFLQKNSDFDDETVITEQYSSKFVEKFTKTIDSTLQLFIKQTHVLVFMYQLPSAVIRLVLAPCIEEE